MSTEPKTVEERIEAAQKAAADYAALRGRETRYPYLSGLLMGQLRDACTMQDAIRRLRWADRAQMISAVDALLNQAHDHANTRGYRGYDAVIEHLDAALEALREARDVADDQPHWSEPKPGDL